MNDANPLLETTGLPRFSAIRPEHVGPAIDKVLSDYRGSIDTLLASDSVRDFDHVMVLGEELEDRLNRAWSPVSHLHSVKDSKALREAYGAALEKVTEHASELGQNRALYAAVKEVAEASDFEALPRASRTLVEHELRDFRLSGVALEEPARSRFREIANRLAKLASEFEEAVLDATDAWSESLGDAAQLAGIPESGREILRAAALEKKQEGWVVTLKQPSVQAVLTYADDRGLRERVYHAYQTRASDQGPNAGEFDNSARIEEIMRLRHEAARLLGFANAAEESLTTKMASSPRQVLEFLHDLAARAKPVAASELAELAAFADAELGIEDLKPWDVAYAAEKLRQRKYALSEEELKPYFALDAVIGGLFTIAQRIFEVTLRRREDVDVWHPDVRYYDLLDRDGKVFAGVYLDLYARTGKRGGAWMDVCASRFRRPDGVRMPVAFLICNFAPPGDARPTLLTHQELLTLFHEFGHGLHHVLTEVDYPAVAGIAGVEWDAVELPSQFMENFGWQRQSLGSVREALADRRAAARRIVRAHARSAALPCGVVSGAPAGVRPVRFSPSSRIRSCARRARARNPRSGARRSRRAAPSRVATFSACVRACLCGRLWRGLLQLFVGRSAVGGCVLEIRGDRCIRSRNGASLSLGDPCGRQLTSDSRKFRGFPWARTATRCAAEKLWARRLTLESQQATVILPCVARC